MNAKKNMLIDVKLIKNGMSNNNRNFMFPFPSFPSLASFYPPPFLSPFFFVDIFGSPIIFLSFPLFFFLQSPHTLLIIHFHHFLSLSSFSAVALLGVFLDVAVVAAATFLRRSNAVHHCNTTRCITFPTPTVAKRPNTAMSSTLVKTNPKDAALDALPHALPIVAFLPLASRIA